MTRRNLLIEAIAAACGWRKVVCQRLELRVIEEPRGVFSLEAKRADRT